MVSGPPEPSCFDLWVGSGWELSRGAILITPGSGAGLPRGVLGQSMPPLPHLERGDDDGLGLAGLP